MKPALLLLFTTLLLCIPLSGLARTCTYSSYKWNTIDRKAVDYHRVEKLYSELSEAEIDPLTGCSVCEQDQVDIQIGNLAPIKVCYVIAEDVSRVLLKSLGAGQVIVELESYRVGLTRGKVDAEGNRTQFSNHSFGTAIDINASFNGLYDNCFSFSINCRLIKGGQWDPGQAESLHAGSLLVELMLEIGLQRGGKIAGKQKDFMHFSLTGY